MCIAAPFFISLNQHLSESPSYQKFTYELLTDKMTKSFSALKIILLINFFVCSQSQGDSLRSALNAINRRQWDLTDYNDNEYGFALERPDDVVFLQSQGFRPDHYYDTGSFQGTFLDDDKQEPNINKRLSSSFRERLEEDNENQLLKGRTQNIVSNMERKGKYNYEDEDYEDLLRELWDKYRRPYERSNNYSPDKKIVYQSLGLDPSGDKIPINRGYSYTYQSEDEQNNNDDDDMYVTQTLRNRNYQKDKRKSNREMQMFNPYRQFQVSKRSSSYPDPTMTHQHKRSTIKRQTDPKVEKELSNIFGGNPTELSSIGNTSISPETPSIKQVISSQVALNITKVTSTNQPPSTENEEMSSAAFLSEKPLQIKKKSIDWSDYFGIDKRKIAGSDDEDKEWLIENFHKTISMSNKKRNSEHPQTDLRKHEKNEVSNVDHAPKQKIDDIDDKLQSIEANIIDQALKYTGAHEGESNPKKVRKIKDEVISRLAAAYSLEKMRKALGEYKSFVSDENGSKNQPEEDYYLSEEKLAEKRSAIPRKQVVDKDRENSDDADNNVKCTEGEEDCYEQNYKTPSDVVESYLGTEECPVINRACNDVTTVMGQYGKLFKTACITYQMCLLCNNNSWFPPTRQCNSLFIGKAYDACRGNSSCQREAQRSIRYLLDVNRSLHAQSQAINDCELSCPDSDVVFDPNYR